MGGEGAGEGGLELAQTDTLQVGEIGRWSCLPCAHGKFSTFAFGHSDQCPHLGRFWVPVVGTQADDVRQAGHMCAAHRKHWCELVAREQQHPQDANQVQLSFHRDYDYDESRPQVLAEATQMPVEFAAPESGTSLSVAHEEIERLRYELAAMHCHVQKTVTTAGAQIEYLRREGIRADGEVLRAGSAWLARQRELESELFASGIRNSSLLTGGQQLQTELALSNHHAERFLELSQQESAACCEERRRRKNLA